VLVIRRRRTRRRLLSPVGVPFLRTKEVAPMLTPNSLRRAVCLAAILGAAGAVLAGCGGSSSALSTVTHASATTPGATTNAAAVGAMAGMKGMAPSAKQISKEYGSGKAVDHIKPIPTQVLATAKWQGMKIQAMAMTPVPFVIFNGQKERMVKPPKHTSFHLMVELSDSRSHFPIPYAGVWATFHRNGKVVYDERQWPMISEYIGPHYGNNVELPGPGHYTISLLISPPVSARHVEYKNVWTKPHRVTYSFNWKPGA
jgi:uncharacterized protein involved in high-affinity Fe2+ transport